MVRPKNMAASTRQHLGSQSRVSPRPDAEQPNVGLTGWYVAVLFAAVLVVYSPALQGQLLWDDDGHLTRWDLRSLGGLWRIWFEPGATQQYYPLLHTAFWIEHQIWGEAVLGYHVLNAGLHAAAACLLGVVLHRLRVPGAILASFLFALHPVCAESVAWISEQKNTLSTVFYLSAALCYLRFADHRRGRDYFAATVFFCAAILTKSVTVTLPAVLLTLSWWQQGQLRWRRDILPLVPWLLAGVAMGVATASVERTQIGAMGHDFDLTLIERIIVAGRACCFYAGSLVWPAQLTFIYPRWEPDSAQIFSYLFPLGVVVVTFAFGRLGRGPLAAGLLFVGTLSPALGFIDAYPFIYSFVADHFQYLASLSAFGLAAAGITIGLSKAPRWAQGFAFATLLGTLGILTWRQSGNYRNATTLYEATLARNPACWMAHNNLAVIFNGSSRPLEAIPHLERALALRPTYPEAENNLGRSLNLANRPSEAIAHLQRAISLQPSYAEAHSNLGISFMAVGRTTDGIAEFQRALALKPSFSMASFNLGLALSRTGKGSEGLAYFEQAVRYQPEFADAELNWGIGLMLANRFPEAEGHLNRAAQLAAGSSATQTTVGRAYANVGRWTEAIAHYERSLEIEPGNADVHLLLSKALRQAGREDDSKLVRSGPAH